MPLLLCVHVCVWTQSCLDFNLRPVALSFRIPSAAKLLDLQCSGRRVATAFLRLDRLKKKYKDHYPPYQERGASEFLMHDLQHMEQFVAPRYYCEQVAFRVLYCAHFLSLVFSHFCFLPPFPSPESGWKGAEKMEEEEVRERGENMDCFRWVLFLLVCSNLFRTILLSHTHARKC